MKGVQELEDWRSTHELLTRKAAIQAFCADCMGNYEDGVKDCNNMNCPLYPYQPYGNYANKSLEVT